MPHVFLSYSREDLPTMHKLRDSLRAQGLDVWTDEHLTPGTDSWKTEIESAIREAGAFVVLLSPDSSESVWVERELDFARARNVPVFPVLARGDRASAVPLELINAQWVDIRSGADYEAQIESLASTIQAHLTGQAPPPIERSTPRRPRRIPVWLIGVIAVGGVCLLSVGVTVALIAADVIPWPGQDSTEVTPQVEEPTVPEEASPDETEPDVAEPPPVPTVNPGLGTFQTEFVESTELVFVARGPTLGGQAACAFHNLALSEQDVGKTLAVDITDVVAELPDYIVGTSNAVSLFLYRSLTGPVEADGLIDLYDSPNAEEIPGVSDGFTLNWTVTQPGDYIVCLEIPVVVYYDETFQAQFASYRVVLSGG